MKNPAFWAAMAGASPDYSTPSAHYQRPSTPSRAVVTPPVVQSTEEVIETHIDGTFTGWTGDNVWKMTNGQIWQQARYAYHYHYAYRPQVLIYYSSITGGWKMKIDGDDDEGLEVKRIR